MPHFVRFSNDELKDRLAALRSRTNKCTPAKRLQLDLQVHQIELEIQNRELREARRALEIARDRYADLYDFAPTGYLTFDSKGCILEINLTGAAMLAAQRVNVVGKPFAAWLSHGESGAFFAHLRQVEQTGRDMVEVRINRSNRSSLNLRLDSVPESKIAGACRATMTDITEIKLWEKLERKREADLAHLERLSTLGTAGSAMAHEIIQPLSAMVCYADAALLSMHKQPMEAEQVIQDLNKIVELGQRAADIVNSISAFAQKGAVKRTPVDLNGIASNAARLLASMAERCNTEIALDLAERLPKINGISVQLEQVVVNFMMNAIESIDAGHPTIRRVTVRTALVGTAVQLSVVDTGNGLTTEIAAHMFEPFFSTKQNGHGIGLALCRTIIKAHGGHVWAKPVSQHDRTAIVGFELPVEHESLDVED